MHLLQHVSCCPQLACTMVSIRQPRCWEKSTVTRTAACRWFQLYLCVPPCGVRGTIKSFVVEPLDGSSARTKISGTLSDFGLVFRHVHRAARAEIVKVFKVQRESDSVEAQQLK